MQGRPEGHRVWLERDGNSAYITVVGKFTFQSYPTLEPIIRGLAPECRRVVFDLTDCEIVDSSAIGLMLVARSIVGEQSGAGEESPIEVRCNPGFVDEVLHRLCMHTIFNIVRPL